MRTQITLNTKEGRKLSISLNEFYTVFQKAYDYTILAESLKINFNNNNNVTHVFICSMYSGNKAVIFHLK